MAGTVILDDPRPVDVLHDGRWLPGSLEAYRRYRDGWRGLVRYRDTEACLGYLHWRGEGELRRAVP